MPEVLAPYEVETITAGFLEEEEIRVVRMPRSRFVQLVDELLVADYPQLRDEILPVAESMIRFPLGEWIHRSRGCGCLVGEYLVATSEIEEYDRRIELTGYSHDGIEDMIRRRPNGNALASFGTRVDSHLTRHLADTGLLRDGHPTDSYYAVQDIVNAIVIEEG